jgi:hypothetical protein
MGARIPKFGTTRPAGCRGHARARIADLRIRTSRRSRSGQSSESVRNGELGGPLYLLFSNNIVYGLIVCAPAPMRVHTLAPPRPSGSTYELLARSVVNSVPYSHDLPIRHVSLPTVVFCR